MNEPNLFRGLNFINKLKSGKPKDDIYKLIELCTIGGNKFNEQKLVLLFKTAALMGKYKDNLYFVRKMYSFMQYNSDLMLITSALESFKSMTFEELNRFESLGSHIKLVIFNFLATNTATNNAFF